MSDYIDRIREARYRAPSGTEFVLQFNDVERSGGKKASVHEFPQQDSPIVQDLGNTAEKYPMQVYFTGPDCDTQADAFWKALSERGPGTLLHPRYGNLRVLPMTWSQAEKLVDGLGRIEFSIDFTIAPPEAKLPLSAVAVDTSIITGTLSTLQQSAAQAGDLLDQANAAAADIAAIKNDVIKFCNSIENGLASVIAAGDQLQSDFNTLQTEIIGTIDTLVNAPGEMFGKMAELASLPAQVVTNIADKVTGYASAITSILAAPPASPAQAIAAVESVYYAFAAVAVATTAGDLQSRQQAGQVVDQINAITAAVQTGVEAIEASIPEYRADATITAALTDLVSKAKATILERAYSLRSERRVVIGADRTPLDLIAEFYGDDMPDIEATLNEFIRTNQLQGDCIIVIPSGSEVLYYV